MPFNHALHIQVCSKVTKQVSYSFDSRLRTDISLLLISQLILPLPTVRRRLTNGRRPDLHPIHALLLLRHLPDLILLRARQHHQRAPVRPVPAVLPVLVPQRHPSPRAETSAVGRDALVHVHGVDPHEIAQSRLATAFLGFLPDRVEPAELVVVLARILGGALAFQDAEHTVYAVVFVEVLLVVAEVRLKIVQIILDDLESVASIDDRFGFGRG